MTPRLFTRILLAMLLLGALGMSGCALVYRVGMALYYEEAELPDEQQRADVPYLEGGDPKHCLDLFLPAAADGWPTVVFVHGGGWNEGDKDLETGGADVYGNIGRFLASRGIGAVTVNYRLVPDVAWPEQIADVAAAVGWVHRNIAGHGGDPDNLFLMGHSAGAQLAMRVALDPAARGAAGVPRAALRGVIGVAGAGYDMVDAKSYELSDTPGYYAQRFDPAGDDPDWQREASPIRFVTPDAPPFLLLIGEREGASLERQTELLRAALEGAGVEHERVVVPGQSHTRIVLTLSRDDQTAGPAILEFVGRAVVQRQAEGQ